MRDERRVEWILKRGNKKKKNQSYAKRASLEHKTALDAERNET